MSTISVSYPDVSRARQLPRFGTVLFLSSLVLFTILSLVTVVSASNAAHPGRDAIAQNAVVPIAVPVPTPPIQGFQSALTATPDISPQPTSELAVVPIRAPIAPSPAKAVQ